MSAIKQYHIYKNSPECPNCRLPMAYLYTHVASNRTVWKCRECDKGKVTTGYPEDDDEGDPSKRPLIFVSALETCEYIIVPGDYYENRRTGKNYLRLQDKQTKVSGRGSRERISTVYALHF